MAAAGPLTARGVPPNRATAMPPTIAATSPAEGATPLARAMARESGTAMQATVIPAMQSSFSQRGETSAAHSGSRWRTPRSGWNRKPGQAPRRRPRAWRMARIFMIEAFKMGLQELA